MRYNIAIIGTFDLENFGDLMFPIVLKKQLEKRIDLKELFLFSANSCNMPLNPETVKIYSIDSLEKVCLENGLNAIVFGGGDVARLDNGFAPEDNYVSYNTYFDMLVTAAVIADKYNIPFIWNCPGVPFEFYGGWAKIVKCITDTYSDYVSVREHGSEKILRACGCEKDIVVSPDTVLSIGTIIDKNENNYFDGLKQEFDFLGGNYIVFQSAINNIIGFAKTINEQLSKTAIENNSKIVFLPIGNVHKDDEHIAKFLKDNSSKDFVTFNRKLNIYEIGCVLANATAFIGTSLHGNVVSNSYGVPSIGLDLFNFVKLRNYFKLVDREEFCIKDVSEISNTLSCMLSKNSLSKIPESREKVEKHFDVVCDFIKQGKQKKGDIKTLLNLCFNSEPILEGNSITVFFDYGDGYTQKNMLSYAVGNIGEKVSLSFTVPHNAKNFRIDPIDNKYCFIKELKILRNGEPVDYRGNYVCTETEEKILFFANRDPQLIVEDVCAGDKISVEFSMISLFLGSGFEKAIPSVEEALLSVHNRIIRADITVQEQSNTITGKELEISNLHSMYNNLELNYNELQSKYNGLQNQYNELNHNYANLSYNYNEMQNSFYWRLTAPARKITHALKMFISKFR